MDVEHLLRVSRNNKPSSTWILWTVLSYKKMDSLVISMWYSSYHTQPLADGITMILHTTLQLLHIQIAASLFVSILLAFETLHQIHNNEFHVVSCVHNDIKPEIWIWKCWSTFLMTRLEFRDKIIHKSNLDYFLRASHHLLSLKYGTVWCGVVWCGVVWYDMVWRGVVQYGTVCCGMVWCNVVWYGMVWCGVVWYGVVWSA